MKKAVLIRSEIMGDVPKELGSKLMGSFLRKLCNKKEKPFWIIFYGTGVKLLTENSPVQDALEILTASGVELLACGTCVRFYDLEEKITFGRISNMDEISTVIMKADDVISIC